MYIFTFFNILKLNSYGIPDVPPKWNIENKTAEEITKLMYSDWLQNEFRFEKESEIIYSFFKCG